MRKSNFSRLLICFAVIVVSGCTKTKPGNEILKNDIRILIANEGQYTQGTASLTAIYQNDSVANDVFRIANKRPLGDVAQAIEYYDDKFYVTLNNSKKIEVMDDENFSSIATITLPDNTVPYYMCILGKDSMAVTDIGANERLMIIDLKTNTLKRSIEKIGFSNRMVLASNKLFIGGYSLRVFDLGKINNSNMRTITDTESNDISKAGNSKIVSDKNGKIWVLTTQALLCIDPITEKCVKMLPFKGVSVGSWDGCMDIDPAKQTLFFTGSVNGVQGILKMNISADAAPESLLFATTGVKVIYNMAVSKQGTIIVNDVEYGSTARGLIHEYDAVGNELKRFEAGIFPQDIFFVED